MMATGPQKEAEESQAKSGGIDNIRFDMKPEELEDYLNQYVIRQDESKPSWQRKYAPITTA